MKSRIYLAGAALAILTPSIAMAQDDGCRRDGSGRVIGTVVGAGAGGVLGNVIAGRGDKTEGSIIGAIVGAVVGNQISKSDRGDCRRAYGYYDQQGRWHATGVSSSDARGYYDRDGRWVEGQPNGYYDNGRWVSGGNDSSTAGYIDRDGQWVPASAVGYYDRNNRWVGGTATGYYDNGRWVAGPTRGRYDARGRWIAGDTGYADENNGNWDAVEQPGYYDSNGRWRAGRAYGYYDARGRWISTRSDGYQSSNDNRDNDQYRPGTGQYDLNQMPTDIPTRISWMREYVRSGVQARRIDRAGAQYARRELTAIETQNRQFNRDGRFTQREEQMIENRLDRLTRRLDRNWDQGRNGRNN